MLPIRDDKMKDRKDQMYEAFVAVMLSFTGGILDIYCLFNYNVYAMLHTGNVIKLAMYLADGNMMMFWTTFTIVFAFAAGILLANMYEDKRKIKGRKNLLVIAILILAAAALIPNDRDPGVLSTLKLIAASLFGFEGAFLVHSFIKFGEYTFSATTMTANINRLVTNLYKRLSTNDKSYNYSVFVYLLIIGFFMLGVGTGYIYLNKITTPASEFMALYRYNRFLLVPLACLLILLAVPAPGREQ